MAGLQQSIFIVLATISLVTSEITSDGLLRIPLVHMESGLQMFLNTGADLKTVDGIYNMSRKGAHTSMVYEDGKPKPKPSNDTLPLYKYFETNYYGVVNIGHPGQTFKMIMDTAWAYTFVISKDCPRTNIPCALHKKYDHSKSSTYKSDGRKFDLGDKFQGYMSKDLFHIAHMNVTNQGFAEMTKLPLIYALYQTDGTIGLGFEELSPDTTPLFYNFYKENNIKAIFSFYINKDPTTTRGGSLFFGGIDYTHNKTEFTEIPIKKLEDKYSYWQFDMQKVTVVESKKKSTDFCKNGCIAVADTSSNTIVGPPDEIKEINRLIGAQTHIPFIFNRYMIPCVLEYKGPKINFTINNKPFQIKASDYIQKLSYSGVTICLSAFQPNDRGVYSNNTWSLGGAFLYQYYTAFDVENHKIMIATAA